MQQRTTIFATFCCALLFSIHVAASQIYQVEVFKEDVLGTRGASDPAGTDGLFGLQGTKGKTGARDDTDFQGKEEHVDQDGPRGSAGPRGISGDYKPTGAKGPRGAPDDPGAMRGYKGARGRLQEGPHDVQSDSGNQGEMDIRGPRGPGGSQGPRGPRGRTRIRRPSGPVYASRSTLEATPSGL